MTPYLLGMQSWQGYGGYVRCLTNVLSGVRGDEEVGCALWKVGRGFSAVGLNYHGEDLLSGVWAVMAIIYERHRLGSSTAEGTAPGVMHRSVDACMRYFLCTKYLFYAGYMYPAGFSGYKSSTSFAMARFFQRKSGTR